MRKWTLHKIFSLQQRPLEPMEILQSLMYGPPPEFAMSEKVFVVFDELIHRIV